MPNVYILDPLQMLWQGSAYELIRLLSESRGPTNAVKRALLLLKWRGTLSVDYLAKDSRVTTEEARNILDFLTKLGICEKTVVELE